MRRKAKAKAVSLLGEASQDSKCSRRGTEGQENAEARQELKFHTKTTERRK